MPSPDANQFVEDVSFYDASDDSEIVAGIAGMHISMVPSVGDPIGLKTTAVTDSAMAKSLPVKGVVTRIERTYWLQETEAGDTDFEWALHLNVYVKRSKY